MMTGISWASPAGRGLFRWVGSAILLCAFSDCGWAEGLGAMTHYQMGLKAERAGNHEQALQHYQNALEAGGDVRATAGALARKAYLQMLRGALDEAAAALNEALQRDPEHIESKLMQARLFLIQDKPRRAEKLIESVSRRPEAELSSAVCFLEAALVHGDAGRASRARKSIAVLAAGRADQSLRIAMQCREDAEIFSASGKKGQTLVAAVLAEIYHSLDPSRLSKEYLALKLYESNQLDAASALYQELLADPESGDAARAMIAQIAAQRKEREMESKRKRLSELTEAAKKADIAGRTDDAIVLYEEIIAFAGDLFSSETLSVRAKLASLKKIQAERMAIEAKTRAFSAMRAGRHDEAVQDLRKAKSVLGVDLVVDGMLAEVLLKSASNSNLASRESALTEILAIDSALAGIDGALPTSIIAQTHAQLAAIMESRGRWPEAVMHFQEARARGGFVPDLTRRLWVARFRAHLFAATFSIAFFAAAICGIYFRWPGFHRIVLTSIRYRLAALRADREGEYHALSALVALMPHREDLRRRLAAQAAQKGDEDVTLYLYEQLYRERSLNPAEMFRLYEIYERRKEADKLYTVGADLLKLTQDPGARIKILDMKFRMDVSGNRTADAILSGRELLTLKPSAQAAEQMVKLINAASPPLAPPDLKTLLPLYRTWLRLNPGAQPRIIADAESALKKWAGAGQEKDATVRQTEQFILDAHLKSGNNAKAAEILEAALAGEPDPVPTLQTLLKIYTALSDPDAVLKTTHRLFAAQPANFEFGINLADLLQVRGDETGAADVYIRLLDHHPNSVELGKTIYDLSRKNADHPEPARLDRAIVMLRALVGKTLLDTREARLLLARCLNRKNLHDESIAILQGIEGGGFPKLRAQSLTAEAFLSKNQAQLACDVLSKVNYADPQMTDDLRKEMRYLHATGLESQQRLAEAAEIYDDLILEDINYRDVKSRHDKLSHVQRRRAAENPCPSCSKPNPVKSKFCAFCGAPFPPTESAAGSSAG